MGLAGIEANVGKIKQLLEQKGGITKAPQNGVEVVVIKESKMKGTYSATVAVGVIQSINVRYFEVSGKVFDDTFRKFQDSVLRIEPKNIAATKGLDFICGVFKDGLVRASDEALWANEFNGLEDLIKVLEKL